MKNKSYTRNTMLAVVLGIFLLAEIFVRTFAPAVILMKLDLPNLVLICLTALLAEHYLTPGAKGNDIAGLALAAVTFGLLSYVGGFAGGAEALWLALGGGAVFALTTWLFGSIQERLASGPAGKAGPVVSAVGLYLAAQCLTGIL